MKIEILKKESDKEKAINILSETGSELLIFLPFSESINDAPKYVSTVRDSVAKITPPFDYNELEKWWHEGNWQIISPVNTNYVPINTFRNNETELKNKLSENQISIIIDSFHDDKEWKIVKET